METSVISPLAEKHFYRKSVARPFHHSRVGRRNWIHTDKAGGQKEMASIILA
jgi:hypothetical protein